MAGAGLSYFVRHLKMRLRRWAVIGAVFTVAVILAWFWGYGCRPAVPAALGLV